jgi:drug/metabolite transporter (DMT)-like permease
MRFTYWLALVIAALGWAAGGLATSAALDEGVGIWTMVAMRVLIAAILLAALAVVRRIPMPSRSVLGFGMVQAVVNLTIPYILFTFAYAEASVGFVGLLAALIPMATALFAHWMLPSEPLSVAKLLALFVSFSGVAFLLLSGDSGLSEGGRPTVAVALALTAIAAIGFSGAFAKRHAGMYNPITITGLQFGFSVIWLTPAMFLIEGAPTDVPGKGWALIVVMAVAGAVIPFLLFFWLLERIDVTQAVLVGYMVPFMALVGGVILLDEELQTGIVVGGALVLTGLVLSDMRSRRDARTNLSETLGIPS